MFRNTLAKLNLQKDSMWHDRKESDADYMASIDLMSRNRRKRSLARD
jgi:hypothetical protein